MKKLSSMRGVFVVLILAAMLIAYYHHMSNISKGKEDEDVVVETSVVTETLSRNLTTNYPSTPKEVIKYFSDITQCFYNEEYTDDELIKLADQMLLLYDDELVNYQDHDVYIMELKNDIAEYKANNYVISSYAPSASTDVEYFSEDGSEWARIWCMYTIKSGKNYKPIQEVFILRKDDKSHWRIFGWRLVENESS
ncbi:MAG: hypothetical protein J6S95_04910 [Lachnospiraceae bacterium]|nr:hypothetical protein [Lachnospiraceae bacterium]MBO7600471.1 hypothetical protein [Lachnospiraceae bacterium]